MLQNNIKYMTPYRIVGYILKEINLNNYVRTFNIISITVSAREIYDSKIATNYLNLVINVIISL